MLITFEKCHTYNKVFFLDLNKLAFYPPFIISLPVGLFSLLRVLGGCKIEWFTEMLIMIEPPNSYKAKYGCPHLTH